MMVRHRKLLLLSVSVSAVFLVLYFYFAVEDSRGANESQIILRQALLDDLETISLRKLNVYENNITVSGFSAGAAMATQMHVAFSSLFSGAALFSQVFYRCGPRNILEFGIRCSKYVPQWFPYKVQYSIDDAKKYGTQGVIDPLENLKDNRVYVWTGAADEYIPSDLVKQQKDFYSEFVANPTEQIQLEVDDRAKHLFPTTNYGGACDAEAGSNLYLGNCNYSGAFRGLKFLLADAAISIPEWDAPDNYEPTSLYMYNQSEFYRGDIKDVAMGTVGFIYIPGACLIRKCYLHFNFHGCNEYPPDVARKYIEHNQFLPLAEKNNIIVIFPLTTKVSSNMDGCWDFYSYTDSNFATRQGKQVQVVHNIYQRLVYGKEENLLIS